jgi:hypothetical protein
MLTCAPNAAPMPIDRSESAANPVAIDESNIVSGAWPRAESASAVARIGLVLLSMICPHRGCGQGCRRRNGYRHEERRHLPNFADECLDGRHVHPRLSVIGRQAALAFTPGGAMSR